MHVLQVISKLGLLDTPRTAWRRDKYDAVWSALREEYQLDIRLEQLSKKVGCSLATLAQFLLVLLEGARPSDALYPAENCFEHCPKHSVCSR